MMNAKNRIWLYFILLTFAGYFIYKFEIEKSFNLFTIYTLTVGFIFLNYLFKFESRKTLPLLFVSSLFLMYGISNEDFVYSLQLKSFAILLLTFIFLITVLLSKLILVFKKIAFVISGIAISSIYIIPSEILSGYKYIPFVLGSFFMFRSISYLHEIKFMKKKVPLTDTINYFLLPPNFSMPLFPIVDYKTFINSYEGINANTVKRGSLFICKGLAQMILYRFIYHEIIIPFDEIQTALQVLIYLVANFLIILRVVGAFHIAIGLVILTGYNIPDIFNNIFFSTGFSDLWRRTNIYWKNFILKLFYYPIYFKIKKIGVYPALFISTIVCFFITWLLHTYQWFWIKGSFPIEIKDVIFWGSFGLLVSINTLMQQKELDRGGIKKEGRYDFFIPALSGLAVLIVMSVLWSIWTCNSLENWWMLVSKLKNFDSQQIQLAFIFSSGYVIVASFYHYYEKHGALKMSFIKNNMNYISFAGFGILSAMLMYASLWGLKINNKFYQTRIAPIISEKLNKADLKVIDNGYYTNLISTNNYCSQVWMNENDISSNWTKYITTKTTKPSYDLMLTENIPGATVKVRDIKYTLNSFGMRDRTYSKVKPDSCYRIIILGGSFECGNGINDGEEFLSLVENALNEKYIALWNGKPVTIEIVNFSSNGYRLLQRLYQYKNNARAWDADALFLFIHNDYNLRIGNYMNRLVYQQFTINDPYVKNIVEITNLKKGDTGPVTRDKLGIYADSINYYAVKQISEIAKEDSTRVFAVYLPTIKDKVSKHDSVFMANIFSWYGLQPINLKGVYAGQDVETLVLSELDFHPNKKGNDLIADKLLSKILEHQEYFNIQFIKK